jgi:holin-like protein
MFLAFRRAASAFLTRLQVPIQVVLYALLFLAADQLVKQFHLPLPANIVGMLMVESWRIFLVVLC